MASKKRVIVIGAGASGMMAAGRAAELGAETILLEKMQRPGKKLLISGKTRCNLTNTKELDDFIVMYGQNGRFLYPAFRRFFRDELLSLLNKYGIETKVERGGRIFPASDSAEDVVSALGRYITDCGVRLLPSVRVTGIRRENGILTGVLADDKFYPADAVVLATGGASYPQTGSTGEGYRIAAGLGHTIVKPRPALVPLIVTEIERAKSMQDISLRNVRLTAYRCHSDEIPSSLVLTRDYGRGIAGRQPPPPVIESRMGEMLITHFGIGGPITLLMSLSIVDALEKGPVSVAIDLKPALDEKKLRERLQRDFNQSGKRDYSDILKGLLPDKMIGPFKEMTEIEPDKYSNQISAAEREKLLSLLKSLRFNIKGPLPIEYAIVTAGGIALNEIEPRTMASRLVKGLYFCGELLDLDADTGGYNLQAAFSTGYLAGESSAQL